ncbi:MAG TPA: helix-turn-helix transcriptional regulator [Vicinamibacterales bacterium]
MQPGSAFGPRLRHERERRQITLKAIADDTKISRSLLEALERDDVSRWPTGIFRRAFVRSYADAIGLNADEIVREFAERFPDPSEPPPPPAQETTQVSIPASPGSPDRVEIVLRFSVPRWWVSWMMWLWRTTPGRQNT